MDAYPVKEYRDWGTEGVLKPLKDDGKEGAKAPAGKRAQVCEWVVGGALIALGVLALFGLLCILEALVTLFTGGTFTLVMPAVLTAALTLALVAAAYLNGSVR